MLIDEKSIQIVKSDIISEIEKRVEDKILEPANAELLKKLINNAETTTEAIEIAKLGTIYKRTGFNFDTKCEKSDNTIKYFKKNTELSFETNPNGITHKLIIGDNYTALLNLLIEYKGKIDVIYIDPPYGKDSMGEFAETNYENAITRDNLLSMLYNRLRIAKLLLSETGVIFCSIDDRNQAYVKCLFDEIFEEKNFWYNLSVVNNLNGNDNSSGMMETQESCLIYSKNKSNFHFGVLPLENEDSSDWQTDELGYWKLGGSLKATGINAPREARPNLFFPIYINKKTLEWSLEEKAGIDYYHLIPLTDGKEMRWYWSKEKFKKDKNEVIVKKVGDTYSLYKKQRPALGDLPSKRGKTTFYSSKYASANSNAKLKSIFTSKLFDYPKSVDLIKDLIYIGSTQNNITVLDFFAGSGTTGQAVLELNKEDNGQRQFILVQLNEDLDNALKEHPKSETIKNQIELCHKYKRPHYLSEITAERLRRVMMGKCYDGSSDFTWIKDNGPLGDNLDVYDIGEVANNETSEGKTPFDVIDETLYGKEKLNISEKIQWVIDNFEITQKRLSDKD